MSEVTPMRPLRGRGLRDQLGLTERLREREGETRVTLGRGLREKGRGPSPRAPGPRATE